MIVDFYTVVTYGKLALVNALIKKVLVGVHWALNPIEVKDYLGQYVLLDRELTRVDQEKKPEEIEFYC